MKLGHFPAALAHSPRFVLRHGLKMLRETFRGSSVWSWLGMEGDLAVFERYRRRRRAERAAIWADLGEEVRRAPSQDESAVV